MFSENMRAVYKRLLMLGLLSMCLVVFGLSDNVETVFASVCYQDCEASRAQCDDSCITSCSATDADCTACVTNCSAQYNSCMRQAIFCTSGSISYTPNCQVGYADHCPVINGVANCNDPSAHSGYFQICDTSGGGQCVSCPAYEFCTGSGGQPPCF